MNNTITDRRIWLAYSGQEPRRNTCDYKLDIQFTR